MTVKRGLRRLTYDRQHSYSFETVIKPMFLINKNVIIAGTKRRKTIFFLNGDCLKKGNFSPIYFKVSNFF